jgi:plasmid stabilization system protein ParE
MATRRRRVVWTQSARQALDDAVAYVAADAPRRSAELLIRVLDAAASLDHFSERGRIVPEVNDPTVRELIVPPYRLIYEVTRDEVRVLGLLHDRQEFFLRRNR